MEREKTEFSTIDEYISSFPEHIQKKMVEIRAIIKGQAPEAKEKISWQMPTFYLNGNLVHFAGHAKHIGFYPGPSGVATFESELTQYKHAKGSIQFLLTEPLPVGLIKRIVGFRVAENLAMKKKK